MEAPLALYRRYRPETFAEVIGQDHVTAPLRNALSNNRVNHAYLFSGPRGCGKTTSARILARAINCEKGPIAEPCGVCKSCTDLARGGPGSIDVIEIDAASHGGVDDARDLRERAFFAPVESRYKIYIIDEAHMVTTQGFNALLKLVEEPPPHLKFIFATTEPDKVIGTIRSRTHHYPFRLVPPKALADYMATLCESEGVAIQPAALPLVVRAGAGSVRDSLSVLDQLIGGAGSDGVTYELAVALLGFTPDSLLDACVDGFAAHDSAAVFETIEKVIETGQDPKRFAEDLLRRLRDLVVLSAVPTAVMSGLIEASEDQGERLQTQAAGIGPAELTRAADIVAAGLLEMRGATAPRLQLELICAKVLLPGADDSTNGIQARLDRMERRLTIGVPGTADAAAGPAGQAGPGTAGSYQAGPGTAGPHQTGPGTAGPHQAGPGTAGSFQAGAGTAGSAAPDSYGDPGQGTPAAAAASRAAARAAATAGTRSASDTAGAPATAADGGGASVGTSTGDAADMPARATTPGAAGTPADAPATGGAPTPGATGAPGGPGDQHGPGGHVASAGPSTGTPGATGDAPADTGVGAGAAGGGAPGTTAVSGATGGGAAGPGSGARPSGASAAPGARTGAWGDETAVGSIPTPSTPAQAQSAPADQAGHGGGASPVQAGPGGGQAAGQAGADAGRGVGQAGAEAGQGVGQAGADAGQGASQAGAGGGAGGGAVGLADIRRLWPEVLEAVKAKRRFAWIMLSQNAQVIAIDDQTLTLGLVNAGARESFARSGSDEILRQAMIDTIGVNRRVEAVVDPSTDPGAGAPGGSGGGRPGPQPGGASPQAGGPGPQAGGGAPQAGGGAPHAGAVGPQSGGAGSHPGGAAPAGGTGGAGGPGGPGGQGGVTGPGASGPGGPGAGPGAGAPDAGSYSAGAGAGGPAVVGGGSGRPGVGGGPGGPGVGGGASGAAASAPGSAAGGPAGAAGSEPGGGGEARGTGGPGAGGPGTANSSRSGQWGDGSGAAIALQEPPDSEYDVPPEDPWEDGPIRPAQEPVGQPGVNRDQAAGNRRAQAASGGQAAAGQAAAEVGGRREQAASKRRAAEAAVAAEQARQAAAAPAAADVPLTPEEEADAIGEDDIVLEEDSRSHTDLLRETLGAQIITEEPN